MWAEAQVRGQGTMLANEDPILQGRGHGSREASEKRRLRCQGHQPPAHPGLWDRMQRAVLSGLLVEFAKGSLALCLAACEH